MSLRTSASAIMSVAWNKDGTQFVTTSLDKSAKVWDFDVKTGEMKVAK